MKGMKVMKHALIRQPVNRNYASLALIATMRLLHRLKKHRASSNYVLLKVNIKTYVYCHDLMHQPLHEKVMLAFLAIDFNALLSE